MKITSIIALMLGLLVGPCVASQNNPVFALIEYNPWAMVMGSDSPSFVLYEDGTVVFLRKDSDKSYSYYTCNISSNKALLAKFTPQTRHDLKDEYELSDWTDQTTTVFFWLGRKISVYGDILNPPEKFGSDDDNDIYERNLKLWKTCPQELRTMLKETRSFDNPQAKKWMPEKVEVMFWPYEYAPEESIIWPKKWPDLEDEDTRQRGKDSYSVYIPSDQYDEIIKFLKTRKDKGAVLINGKKMAASIRFPFPQEKQWMKQ